MRTRNVNIKSDFIVYEKGHPSLPFVFTYHNIGSPEVNPYVASYDGTTYTNCRMLDDGTLKVWFNGHTFHKGTLYCQRQWTITDSDFPAGIYKPLTDEPNGVIMTTDVTDGTSATISLPAFYMQGLQGLSAYQLAVAQGFTGTIDQWLASLKYVMSEAEFNALVSSVASVIDISSKADKAYVDAEFAKKHLQIKGNIRLINNDSTQDEILESLGCSNVEDYLALHAKILAAETISFAFHTGDPTDHKVVVISYHNAYDDSSLIFSFRINQRIYRIETLFNSVGTLFAFVDEYLIPTFNDLDSLFLQITTELERKADKSGLITLSTEVFPDPIYTFPNNP